MADPLEVFLAFARLGLLAFGGALGILPEMGRDLVGRHGWLTARAFADGYALGQLAPGPNMLAVVFYGFGAGGVLGGLGAALGMFGPTAVVAALLGRAWGLMGDAPWPRAVRQALLPVGLGLMAGGAVALGRAALTDALAVVLAALGLAAMLTGRASPVAVVLAGGALGALAALAGGR